MTDDFFNDPFEDLVNQMFGRGATRRARVMRRSSEEDEEGSELGFIETDTAVYCILELPGYTEDEVFVKVKGRELEIHAQKKKLGQVKEYLIPKLERGQIIQRTLPESASSKKYASTYRNGILEVRFEVQ